jgi:hypothetical protein
MTFSRLPMGRLQGSFSATPVTARRERRAERV